MCLIPIISGTHTSLSERELDQSSRGLHVDIHERSGVRCTCKHKYQPLHPANTTREALGLFCAHGRKGGEVSGGETDWFHCWRWFVWVFFFLPPPAFVFVFPHSEQVPPCVNYEWACHCTLSDRLKLACGIFCVLLSLSLRAGVAFSSPARDSLTQNALSSAPRVERLSSLLARLILTTVDTLDMFN